MKLKYEKACQEAGLSEEQTKKIRDYFDSEKKKLRRDKEIREKRGITFSYLTTSEDESEVAGDLEMREIIDDSDMEEETWHKMQIEMMQMALNELSAEDREFLLSLYSMEYGAETIMAEKMGIIRECYRNYLSEWAKMPIEELVNKADEVTLITKIAKILPDVITEECADYLCKYVNPINAV